MAQKMLIETTYGEETRLAVVKDGALEKFDFESPERKNHKGNIYLAKIKRVEPSLQAAFVDYGAERHGFLPFSEIHSSYYRIPVGDRKPEDDDVDPEQDDDGEDSDPKGRRGRRSSGRRRSERPRYHIQDVIHNDQIILVQLTKEERGNKGAAFTSRIALPGRYCVLMTNSTRGSGISRKIEDVAERKNLRSIFASLDVPEGMSVIIRTAGRERTKTEVKRDFEYLLRKWDEIRETTIHSAAPKLIYEDGALIQRAVRDLYQREIDEILVDSEEGHKAVRKALSQFVPSHVRKVKRYEEDVPLFRKFDIESQIEAAFNPVCPLKSGGYLVMNVTEAVITIDVNSGRSTRQRNIEDTALKINLEAAWEAARQLRLRNLAGLIVIDFIDMAKKGNNAKVEKALAEALKEDRSRIQTSRISGFGLLEMSRQRMGPSLIDRSTILCPECEGLGRVQLPTSQALQVLRAIAHHAGENPSSRLEVATRSSILDYLLNDKRQALSDIERQHDVRIRVRGESVEGGGLFRIETTAGDGDGDGKGALSARPADKPRSGRRTTAAGAPRPTRSRRQGSDQGNDKTPASTRSRASVKPKKDGGESADPAKDAAKDSETKSASPPSSRASSRSSSRASSRSSSRASSRSSSRSSRGGSAADGSKASGEAAAGSRSSGDGAAADDSRSAQKPRSPRSPRSSRSRSRRAAAPAADRSETAATPPSSPGEEARLKRRDFW